MYTTCVFCSSVLWDWDCASVPLLLGPAEDERGGQEVGGKTHGRLLERSTRGCGQPLQAAHRSDTSLCSFGIYIKIHKITDSEKKKRSPSSFLFCSPTEFHRNSGDLHQAGLQGYCPGTSTAGVQTLLAQSPQPQQVTHPQITLSTVHSATDGDITATTRPATLELC